MTEEIDKYVSSHYEQWVNYARYHIRVSGQMFAPEEVVNDILCALLGKSLERVERLIRQQTATGTGFDFFVMRIIKINIYSPRSPFRYQRGQHCIDRLDDKLYSVPAPSSDLEYERAHEMIREVFDGLEYSSQSKRIFAWRFFDDRPFSEWLGPESQKYLYETYNRIFLILSAKIRKIIRP